ncbi:hypothetical protein SO694_cp00102 (chloroplast) [Aureococcus anophagefferens]|jgi:hypothetical protein|uniref:Uncharacterized protein n=1 Tax=Aureococcus anophagefferens TaxID=44056 RepID=A0ABR1G531_AURAN
MNLILFLINIFIIILVLTRIPNVNTAAMDIDQNPKILNPLISLFTVILLASNVYIQVTS